MSTQVYIPYTMLDTAWANYLSIVDFLQLYISPNNTVSANIIKAAVDTLINMRNNINGFLTLNALQTEIANINQGLALPVQIDSDILNYAATRAASIQFAESQLNSLLSSAIDQSVNITSIANGEVGLPDTGILSFWMAFDYEPPAASLTQSNFTTTLATQSSWWAIYAVALNNAFVNQEGDAVESFNRQSAIAEAVSNQLSNFSNSFSSELSIRQAWNLMVVSPSILMTAQILYTNPSNARLQLFNTLRYLIDTTITQLNALLVSFQNNGLQSVNIIIVRQNDSLPNIAAREMGNFEDWTQIAALNGLSPPYYITEGQQLFIPSGVTTTGPAPNYLTNYLGTDLYYGPLGSNMLPWTGDFFTISGYNNLAFALNRALITTQGTLIYHPNYGSRIPPLIGNIEDVEIELMIPTYASACILYDPRVQSIPSYSVNSYPNNLISYQATIQPNGFNTASTNLNLVLQP